LFLLLMQIISATDDKCFVVMKINRNVSKAV
jgi:hypothetical protein